MEIAYNHLFDEMPCYVTVQDSNLRIVHANRRFREHFGAAADAYCYQIYKHRPEQCEDCPVMRTFWDGKSHSSEEQVTPKDGRPVSVIVYTTPIYDEQGDITAVMEMSTDITEIKKLQKQLRESQQRYRQLFEEVPCYISIQDNDLHIVDANRKFREDFGIPYGKNCFEVYKHRKEECLNCTVRRTFEDGCTYVHEEVVTAASGERINVLVNTSPIKDNDGSIVSVMELSANITQIRQLQSQLTSIGLLISSISHGLKGLLNGLDGGIYLVDSGLKNDSRERLEKGWDIVKRNVSRIRSMVLDILYYAKDREPDWQELSGQQLLEEIYGLLEKKASDLNVQFKMDNNSGEGKFEGDYKAIRTLLVNLIENSLDACRLDKKKDNHSVSFSYSGDDKYIDFIIEDNGIGMDRETREKAFSLFFSSKGHEGTGLGLFISNKIAQSHGGSINIESEENVGTKFVVRLPKTQPSPPPVEK